MSNEPIVAAGTTIITLSFAFGYFYFIDETIPSYFYALNCDIKTQKRQKLTRGTLGDRLGYIRWVNNL